MFHYILLIVSSALVSDVFVALITHIFQNQNQNQNQPPLLCAGGGTERKASDDLNNQAGS